MKQSKLLVVFLLLVMAGATAGSVLAVEGAGTQARKTPEQIEAYKAELKAQKTGEIEAQKAKLRAQKATEIEAYQAELRAQKAAKATQFEARKAEAQKEKEQKPAQREGLAQERKPDVQETREQRAQEVQARVSERLAHLVEGLTEKVGKYYERLSQLSEKLQTRIAELKAAGVDTTVAQTKLDVADVLLEKAYDDALIAIKKIQATTVTDAKSLEEVVSLVKELKDPFRAALAAYKEVTQELRIAVAAANSAGINTEEVKE